MSSRLNQYIPFINPSYRYNQFSFCLKLNQRMKAASLRKKTYYNVTKKGARKQIPEKKVEEIEKFVNRECFPPIAAIRRWKIWINTHNGYNPKKCSICNLKKSSLVQTKLLF